MEKAGVARVSAGSASCARHGLVQRIGKEMLESRSCEMMFVGATPFIDLKRMMTRHVNEANA